MSRSPTPPLHLIHMSICLLSMPLSEDYWCPAFDIWHIMCHNVSSNELTQWRRGRKKQKLAAVSSQNRSQFFFFFLCSSSLILSPVSIMASPVKCYLTSAGLCVALSGVCHLMCHPHRWSWIWLWVGGLIIQQISNFVTLKCKAKVISSSLF